MNRLRTGRWLVSKPRNANRIMIFYLCQLVIPAAYLYEMPVVQRVFGLALIALFGWIYSLSFSAEGRRRILSVLGMTVIMWIMAWWMSAGYLSIIYYPAAVLCLMARRYLLMGSSILLLGSGIEVALLFHRFQANLMVYFPAILGALFGVLAMMFMVRYYSELHRTNRELAKANAEIERLTKVAERERISRDLHDVMGHQLSMITLKAQVASKLLAKGRDYADAQTEIVDIEQAAREALSRVREYVSAMRQADFGEEWVAAADLLKTANIQSSFDYNLDSERMGPTYQVLAMCLREAVTNIVRHSSATRAYANVGMDDEGYIQLTVADNGRGFAVTSGAISEVENFDLWTRNGIKGMRARVNALGGEIQVWCKQSKFACPSNGFSDRIEFERSTVLHIRVPGATVSPIREVVQ